MKHRSKKENKDILGFLGLAHGDYLAARLLLLNELLPQGVQLAATAVEKMLKALILTKGNRCNGHLGENLINNINNKFPALYAKMNEDFINYLRKAYKLRYHDDKKTRFTLVINQFRTLIELDKLIQTIDSGFKIERNGSPQKTPYQEGVNKGEALLLNDNHLFMDISLEQYCQRANRVYEVAIEPESNGLSVLYTTEGVNISGSFLKAVDLSTSKNTMQFTLG